LSSERSDKTGCKADQNKSKIKIFDMKTMLLFLSVLLGCTLCSANDGKPNVLFIAIDDLNDWTGMLKGNSQALTPHMDKLASIGMVFTNAHCAAPACGPSRAAIMSGIRPSTSGNYVNQASIEWKPFCVSKKQP